MTVTEVILLQTLTIAVGQPTASSVMKSVKRTIRQLVRRFGYDIVPFREEREWPPDFGKDEIQIIRSVRPYTMTSPERLCALIQAVKYVVQNDIEGDIVECGVWKGGSMMTVAMTLKRLGSQRDLYLFDTFEGMTKPSDKDVSYRGTSASHKFERLATDDDVSDWARASLQDVTKAMYSTGYDPARIHFIKGKVEETIPVNAPKLISLLRLDTDWYESTAHELVHLFPRLSHRGVLIIDDYGHWLGARRAVDEYIAENKLCILLNRIDYTGRIGIKL
ncbi:MAG: TylF/MycF/NovP-related O-methyltransferase [Chloroflexota bacterium]